ncbi:hypothetical protein [Mycobacterium colombiense]|uniref:hypothetical protein n=1 Tax=Mycobacterium colombiense TaxID=339268 RepID=UPI0015C579FD|nr:hypothetical protein [Mycobacterium colombiense]
MNAIVAVCPGRIAKTALCGRPTRIRENADGLKGVAAKRDTSLPNGLKSNFQYGISRLPKLRVRDWLFDWRFAAGSAAAETDKSRLIGYVGGGAG